MAKGSFLRTIASAFVEVQEDNVPETAQQVQQPASVQPVIMSAPVQQQPVNNDGAIPGQLDNSLFEQLCEIIEESNLPGPDYVELTKASQNDTMKAAIPDENARLTAAYISMKATAPQLNRNVVLGSIDEYMRILEEERSKGLSQLQEVWKEKVEGPEKAVTEAQAEIQALQAQLQEKINFVATQKNEVAKTKNECNIKKANFNYTFDVFLKKLSDDKVKLSTILVD